MGMDRRKAQYGLTGVLAKDLTREGVFSSLRKARTFATSGQRSVLILEINGTFMGDTLHLNGDDRRLTASVKAWTCDEIERLDVLCNGIVIESRELGGRNLEAAYEIGHAPGIGRGLDNADDRSVDGSPDKGVDSGALNTKHFVYVRIREKSGKMAWTSPVLIQGPGSR